MKRLLSACALAVGLMAASTSGAQAADRDDFPSCYGLIKRNDLAAQPAERELFVVIDQTLQFPEAIQKSVQSKVFHYLHPGDRITIMTFSAMASGRYASMPLTGKWDYPISEEIRYRTGINVLRGFDNCMAKQKQYLASKVAATLTSAFAGGSTKLPKTELIDSLTYFAKGGVVQSTAKEKRVLIVSDMVENSQAISFYKRGNKGTIDAAAAMKKVEKNGMITDWMGADVYVLGAGLSDTKAYHSSVYLNSLREFWQQYFTAAHANLVGWGAPELLEDIQ